MKQRLLEQFTGDDQRVRFVASEFDVAVKSTAVGCTHADIAANPCGEKEESTVEKMPLGCPRKGDIIHPEGLDLGG